MKTYTVKYLEHSNPNKNGNKGKHWKNLEENYKTQKFNSIESAMDAMNDKRERLSVAYPNDVILKAKIMSGKEVVKEIEF